MWWEEEDNIVKDGEMRERNSDPMMVPKGAATHRKTIPIILGNPIEKTIKLLQPQPQNTLHLSKL